MAWTRYDLWMKLGKLRRPARLDRDLVKEGHFRCREQLEDAARKLDAIGRYDEALAVRP